MALSNKKLAVTAIQKNLKKVPEWMCNTKKSEISRTFIFSSFMHGFAFVAKVAVHAEVIGHHPDIELSYGKVKIKLTTHDVKGLTLADFELARKIDALKV
jgi:4a-hydroxytetrahydrobiopterin dehydratase